ncbi:MAG: glycolate oxidase subunit GlcE [Rhodocyclaceae bacterium]|nr:glycolate oxidase subunit GlcE [Rhodocyclaceae bacterium]
MNSQIREWCDRIRLAGQSGTALELRGGGTKAFYGHAPEGEVLDTRAWRGVDSYEPTELVITLRAGTPLTEVAEVLAERGQELPFEPPAFGEGATIGGVVAAGLSGPRRMAVGSLRDFVLGCRIVDGKGEVMRFGGQVMKNVAGYDVSRLMAGSMGTLALMLDVSLKVLPRPVADFSLRFEIDQATAINRLNQWGGQPLPIAASFWHEGALYLRLAGAGAAVEAAVRSLGGEALGDDDATRLWREVREQTHPFFGGEAPLWRLSLPTDAPPQAVTGATALEWGGAQRWLRGEHDAVALRKAVAAAGGHATLFRGGDKSVGVFHPLSPVVARINRRIKTALDPHGVFGPGRLYRED